MTESTGRILSRDILYGDGLRERTLPEGPVVFSMPDTRVSFYYQCRSCLQVIHLVHSRFRVKPLEVLKARTYCLWHQYLIYLVYLRTY